MTTRPPSDQEFALKLLDARRELLRLRYVVKRLSEATMVNGADDIAERALQKALVAQHRQAMLCNRLDAVLELSDRINEEIAAS